MWLAALAFVLAVPAGAQTLQGVVVDPPNPTSRDRVRLTFVGTRHPECPLVIEGGAKDPAGSSIGFSATIPECGSPLPAEEEFQKTFEMEDPLEAETYLVHVLDGRAVNGRWWVFLASMTGLPFTVTIQQCPASPLAGQPCNVKTYTNPKGVNRNVLDVNAFPEL